MVVVQVEVVLVVEVVVVVVDIELKYRDNAYYLPQQRLQIVIF